ncbi:MAG: hypothetical protein U0Y68_08545 [Blastocatellia bacterium]
MTKDPDGNKEVLTGFITEEAGFTGRATSLAGVGRTRRQYGKSDRYCDNRLSSWSASDESHQSGWRSAFDFAVTDNGTPSLILSPHHSQRP